MAGRSSRREGGTGNERIQALVDQKLSEGLQYEALQLYRGVVSRKSARGDDSSAMAIAEQGIGVLLREGCADSATELGNTLVDILSSHELLPTEERLDLIKRINNKYEDAKRTESLAEEDRQAAAGVERAGAANTGVEGVEKKREEKAGGNVKTSRGTPSVGTLQGRFLKLAVGWTAARGPRLGGDPGLCALLGRCIWCEGGKDRGMKYLVLGERPQELCDLIIQDVSDERARELWVAKGVLQFASKSSLRDANALLGAFQRQKSEKSKGLLAFCGLLLKTCEYDAAPVFKKLLEVFRAELSVDDSLFGRMYAAAAVKLAGYGPFFGSDGKAAFFQTWRAAIGIKSMGVQHISPVVMKLLSFLPFAPFKLWFVEKIGIVYFHVRLRPASMLDNIMGMLGGGTPK